MLTFEPEPVHRQGQQPEPPRAAPGRRKPRPAATSRRPRGPTAASVQQKFKQVRREYNAFVRAYGHQLDARWQKILFSHTYGSKDQKAYRALNNQLDDLRRRMKRIRGAGG